tara:strand:+ start:4003 stop:6558 length:2556 start_codon:yes stop_codon:yes gene_type:complete
MYKFFLILLGLLSFTFAQHNHNHAIDDNGYIRCLTDELEQELQLLNPEFIAERDAQLEKAKQLLRENPQWRTDSSTQNTIYIPVVFHVLYFNSGDNTSAFQIGANFDQINLDFQNLNPDGDEIPSAPNPSDAPYDPGVDYSHQAVRGTHNVVFVGAAGETAGSQLIEGTTILRYQINSSSVSGVSDASSTASGITPDQSSWPGGSGGYKNGYLNIYIAPLTGGLLGQAYLGFPESVVLNDSVGSVENPGSTSGYNRGRTLTHELGHNFTFNHVFNSSNCGDFLWNDIPAQYVNNRGANIYEWPAGSGNFWGRDGENSCISSTGKGDQFMNYMDYVYDDQMRMFSEEQALDGYAWAQSRTWAQVVSGVNTQISSSVSYATSDDGFTVDVTFGEEVSGFTQDDLVLTNATVTAFNDADGTNFSFDVEAITDGEVKVSIEANSCVGVDSGNNNFESNEVVVIVDRAVPIAGSLSIDNIKDSQYITQAPSLNLSLNDFTDVTSGVGLYYVSVGLSPQGQEILPFTAFSDSGINLNNLGLLDYQQYYVNVYAQDLVGLNSSTVSSSFYYFGTLLGDSNNDWIINFEDYASFISNYPGVDIAPVTGSAPYFFPNFDGVSDANDLAMFESMWNWSINENGRTVPNYTLQGDSPFLRILNGKLIVRFPQEASTAQFYFEYDTEKYLIDYLSSNLNNNLVLTANNQEDGIIQVESADFRLDRSTPLEMTFSFQNLTDTYEFMRVSYSSYNKSNQLVSEGYNLIQTAPSTYRLSQSYPNPFTDGGTTIEFDMPVTENITMVILDIRGRAVRTLIDKEQRFGYQSVVWDAKNDDGDDVSSGVYFYQIRSSNFNAVGKLVFVK